MKLNMTAMQIQRHETHPRSTEYKRACQKPNSYQFFSINRYRRDDMD